MACRGSFSTAICCPIRSGGCIRSPVAGRDPTRRSRKRWSIFSIEDHLRPVDRLKRTPDGKLIFLDENSGNWKCATLPEGDDPPVWVADVLDRQRQGEWGLVTESLSRFLVTFCLKELLFGSKFTLMDKGLEQLFESSKAEAIPLWTEGAYPNWEREVLLLPPPRVGPGRRPWRRDLVRCEPRGGHPLPGITAGRDPASGIVPGVFLVARHPTGRFGQLDPAEPVRLIRPRPARHFRLRIRARSTEGRLHGG